MSEVAEYIEPRIGGSYRACLQFARYLIANCETFWQEILEVSGPTAALERVYIQETLAEESQQTVSEFEGGEPPETCPRPYAVIMDESRTRRKIACGVFEAEGVLMLVIECLVPTELQVDPVNDAEDLRIEKFKGRIDWRTSLAGKIEDELLELSGKADADGNPFLNLTDLELIIPPADADDAQLEDHIGFALALGWK
jgi:hypothetical protein